MAVIAAWPEIRTVFQILETFLVAAGKRSKTFLPELDEKENEAQNEIEGNLFHQEAAKIFYLMQGGVFYYFW